MIRILFICLLSATGLYGQFNRFVAPLEGKSGEDFVIVNYVDWVLDGFQDNHCGSKSYDGHQGTDIVLKSFVQMDQGVYVTAVDNGIVTFVQDGLFDRQTESVPERGFGNYIAIRHTGKLYTYYAHLKKGSILVMPGDTVIAGQRIAQVGSSGNSTDPHLHFEMWYDSTILIDPFAGPCGNSSTYWIDPYPYDTSYNLWDSGLIGYVPHLDSLRERIGAQDSFTQKDSIITFWALQYGLRSGDSSRIEWYTPDGNLWFSFSNTYQKDWWYHYYYSYIFRPEPMIPGTWSYKYFLNDQLIKSAVFDLELVNSTQQEQIKVPISYQINGSTVSVELPQSISPHAWSLHSMDGKQLLHSRLDNRMRRFELDISELMPQQIYVLTIQHNKGRSSVKLDWRTQ